ncbi:MAG: hypothetical protein WD052_09740 [Bacteroidales bacterium]
MKHKGNSSHVIQWLGCSVTIVDPGIPFQNRFIGKWKTFKVNHDGPAFWSHTISPRGRDKDEEKTGRIKAMDYLQCFIGCM